MEAPYKLERVKIPHGWHHKITVNGRATGHYMDSASPIAPKALQDTLARLNTTVVLDKIASEMGLSDNWLESHE